LRYGNLTGKRKNNVAFKLIINYNNQVNTPKLHFITNGTHFSYDKHQNEITKVVTISNVKEHRNIATLGDYCPLTKADLKYFVKLYPIHWITL